MLRASLLVSLHLLLHVMPFSTPLPTPPEEEMPASSSLSSLPPGLEYYNAETGERIDASELNLGDATPSFYDAETGEPVDAAVLQQAQGGGIEEEEEEEPVDLFQNINMDSTYTLLDQVTRVPVMGMGMHGMEPGDETYYAIREALEAGYRHFDDTMKNGHGKLDFLAALKDSLVKRKDVTISMKFPVSETGYEGTLKDIKGTLKEWSIKAFDVCLIESPRGGKIIETWDALNEARHQHMCTTIGVSNFDVAHMKAIEENKRLSPVVNQIEMHPLIYPSRRELLKYCMKRGILIQAYGSLYGGHEGMMSHYDQVNAAAIAHGKTTAQILLRWGFQLGFQLIPKSTQAKRMIENSQIFDFSLDKKEMKGISECNDGSGSGKLFNYWNPMIEPVHLGDLSYGEAIAQYQGKIYDAQQKEAKEKEEEEKKQKKKEARERKRSSSSGVLPTPQAS